ncbi:MAG: hypothetical protein M3Q84_02405, partial [Actinomycetota bacterium]|nr:hypothetical protein [Actinomycetota bacterium]
MTNAIGKYRDLVAWALVAVVTVLALRALLDFSFVELERGEGDFARSAAMATTPLVLIVAALIAGTVALVVTAGGSAPARSARLQLMLAGGALALLALLGLLALVFGLAEDGETGLQKFLGLLYWLAALLLAVAVGLVIAGLARSSELARSKPSAYQYPGGYD